MKLYMQLVIYKHVNAHYHCDTQRCFHLLDAANLVVTLILESHHSSYPQDLISGLNIFREK